MQLHVRCRLTLLLSFFCSFCSCLRRWGFDERQVVLARRRMQQQRKAFCVILGETTVSGDFRVVALDKIREVLNGVGEDGVAGKFLHFPGKWQSFALVTCPKSRRKKKKENKEAKKNEEKQKSKENPKNDKCGKIPPIPSTPTPLRISQKTITPGSLFVLN